MSSSRTPSLIAAVRRGLSSALARRSALYAISNLGSRALPFLLLPILTRYLTERDFGAYAMFVAISNLLAPLIGFSTIGAVTQQYFLRDHESFGRYVGASIVILAASTAAVGIMVTLLASHLSLVAGIPPVWLWAAVGVAVGRFLGQLTQACFQVQHRARPYAGILIAQTAIIAGTSLVLVVGMGTDWRGRAAADPTAFLLVGLVGALVLRRGGLMRPGLEGDDFRHAVRFGSGTVPHAYGSALLLTTDRIVLTNMIGLASTGVYAVGAQVAQLIGILEHSFNLAWVPWLYERLKEGKPEDLAQIRRITRVYYVLILVVSLVFAWSVPLFIGVLVGDRFRGASDFVFWLSLAAAFTGMYKMVVNQLMFVGRTRALASITIATALVNVPLTILLVARNGPIGAAQSVAAAQLFLFLLTRRVSNRVMAEIETYGSASIL